MSECVIVLGPYRSGTSLAAQVIERLGVDFGPRPELLAPNRFNPGGYLERGDVNALNRQLVVSAGRALGEPGMYVRIGAENDVPGLQSLSVVASGYGLAQRRFGTVSVIGPVRMDYAIAIDTVRVVARQLSRFVQDVY